MILERIAVDYRKKSKVGFEVFPFNNSMSDSVVDPYNVLLFMPWLLDYTEVSFLFDNRKLYNICRNYLRITEPTPSYNDLNSIIAKIQSSITCSLRFEGELNVDLNEYQTDRMCPFPRLHFIVPSMAPIIHRDDKDIKKVAEII